MQSHFTPQAHDIISQQDGRYQLLDLRLEQSVDPLKLAPLPLELKMAWDFAEAIALSRIALEKQNRIELQIRTNKLDKALTVAMSVFSTTLAGLTVYEIDAGDYVHAPVGAFTSMAFAGIAIATHRSTKNHGK